MKIGIVDYGVGNILSISSAIRKFNVDPILCSNVEAIESCDGIVLPGVGAFPTGMRNLHNLGLVEPIKNAADKSIPILGICLGMQLLFRSSDEHSLTSGLSLINGQVKKIDSKGERLPHIGWNILNKVNHSWSSTLLDGIRFDDELYFVHSYCAVGVSNENVLATTSYGGHEFPSVVQRDQVYGCQFHPEKSGDVGLSIISSFIRICMERK